MEKKIIIDQFNPNTNNMETFLQDVGTMFQLNSYSFIARFYTDSKKIRVRIINFSNGLLNVLAIVTSRSGKIVTYPKVESDETIIQVLECEEEIRHIEYRVSLSKDISLPFQTAINYSEM